MPPTTCRERKAIALDVGVSRARAGVPIDALMTAIRLDFSILWGAITSVARPEDAPLLVGHTARVWEVVDGYAGETQRAYVAELARIQAEAASMRQGYLATLFSEKNLAAATLERIAAELGQPLETEYVVVAALGEQIPAMRLALANERASNRVYTYSLSDALVVFYPARRAGRLRGPAARRPDREARAADSSPTPARSRRFPRPRASPGRWPSCSSHDESGAMTWARGWARMARRELAEAGAPGLGEVERALEQCGAAERRRLTEAVRAYLQTGSVGQAADELFCHRNTLMNRLNRFAALTGVDPAIPVQAARLVVGWS